MTGALGNNESLVTLVANSGNGYESALKNHRETEHPKNDALQKSPTIATPASHKREKCRECKYIRSIVLRETNKMPFFKWLLQ